MLRVTPSLALCTVAGLALVGCAPTESSPAESHAESPQATETAPAEAIDPDAIRDYEFGNEIWAIDLGTQDNVIELFELVNGEHISSHGTLRVDAENILYSDANDDGILDAAVPLVVDVDDRVELTEWYIWLGESDGKPSQVDHRIAMHGDCNVQIQSIEPTEQGFTLREALNTLYAPDACDFATFSQVQTRTVAVTEEGPEGQTWPVMIEPFAGYGGVCPVAPPTESIPIDESYSELHHVAPIHDSTSPNADGLSALMTTQDHYFVPQYPDWELGGLGQDGAADDGSLYIGCTWHENAWPWWMTQDLSTFFELPW